MESELHFLGQDVFRRTKVRGDGNCLFRCMSRHLWGTEDHHHIVRQEIVDKVVRDWGEIGDHMAAYYDDGRGDSAEAYSLAMRDSRNKQYGSEIEMRIFCQLHNRNAVVYQLADVNRTEYNPNSSDTIFITTPRLVDEDLGPDMNVHFLFVGMRIGERSEGHFDLLEKIDSTQIPIICGPFHVSKERNVPFDVEIFSNSNNLVENGNTNEIESNDKVVPNSEKNKEEIGTLFKLILLRTGCTYDSMRRNAITSAKIIKDCSLEIFGDDSKKHVKLLRNIYNTNYVEIKSELLAKHEAASLVAKGTKHDEMLRFIAKVICNLRGNNTKASYVIDNANEVFNDIVGDMLTQKGWSLRNNKSLKKCKTYYRSFINYLVTTKAEYVSFCPVSTSVTEVNAGELSTDGEHCRISKSNLCREEKAICWYCSTSDESNSNLMAERTTLNTDLSTWESAVAKDASLNNMKKEMLSEHRRHGGCCTWTQDRIYNPPEKDSTTFCNSTCVLTDCMFNECSNFFKLTVNKQGNTVNIELSDHRSNCSSVYDVRGHEEFYEKQGIPFDRMDDVLYKYRDWSVVFDPNSVRDVVEVMPIETTEPHSNYFSEIMTLYGPHIDEKKETETDTHISHNTLVTTKRGKREQIINKSYSCFEGVLKGYLNTISMTGEKFIEQLRMWIRKEIITQLNIHCRIIFKLWRKPKKGIEYVMYATCGSNINQNCKDYKLIISLEHNCIEIFSRGPENPCHEGKPRAYQIKGSERDQYKTVLKEKDAKSAQNLDIKMLNEKARLDLNMQSVRTLLTLRKCRSEAFKEDDMHSDDLLDVIIMSKSEQVIPVEERFIRQVIAMPLQVYLYSDGQRDLVMNKDVLVAYFDATGTIVRNVPLSLEKDIYYYALVVNINAEVIPVAELLSEVHDIPAIQNFFNTFKYYFLNKNKLKWPVIKRVVCDWSWAIIIGIISAWNSMDLLQYLKICYKLSKKSCDENDYKHIVTVHICCAHFMKMISCNISKHNIKKKDVKYFVMKTMAALVMCNQISEVETIFESFAIVLLSDKTYSVTATALSNVQNIIENTDSEITEIEDESQNSTSDIYEDYVKGQTKVDSPFNKRFMEIVKAATEQLEAIREHETEDKEVNTFYCPSFFDYVQTHLMPLLPLWSGLMIGIHPVTEEMVGRFSNSNVENYFKIVKHRLLKSKGHLKLGRVIRVLRENVVTTLNNIRINISEYNKESKKRKLNTYCTKKMPKLRKTTKNGCQEKLSENNGSEKSELNNIITFESKQSHKCESICEDVSNQFHLNELPVKHKKIDNELAQQHNSFDEDDVDDPNLVECWLKRKKSLTSYFPSAPSTMFFDKEQVPISFTTTDIKPDAENITSKSINEKKSVFRISLSHDYPHKESMSNGLFLNPEYYMTDEEFVVSTFRRISPNKQLALYTHVFSTLKGSAQFQQGAVDACIAALIKLANNKCVKFVNTDTAHSMLRQKSITIASNVWHYFKDLRNFDLLVMPYIVPNQHHYCLIIGDLRSKSCVFYNPLPTYPDSTHVGHEKFRHFLQQLNNTQYKSEFSNVNDWTYINGKGPVQEDNVNCGLYVVRFVECWLLKTEDIETKINVHEYRTYLQRLCLEKSDNMSELCLYCGKGETRCKIWVMCDNCKRWVHYKPCLNYLGVPQSEIESLAFVYECKLCVHYRSTTNKQPWDTT